MLAERKKLFMWIIVSVLMAVIFIAWGSYLKYNFLSRSTKKENSDFREAAKEFNKTFGEMKEGFSKFGQLFEAKTPSLSNQEIAALKKKIEEKTKETAGQGKNYQNLESGFEIIYPDDWLYADDSKGNPAMFYDPLARDEREKKNGELSQGAKLEIYIEESIIAQKDANKSLRDYVKKQTADVQERQQGKVLAEEELFLDGQLAIQQQIEARGFSIITYTSKGNNIYSLIMYLGGEGEKESYLGTYQQILSTFKFTN